MRRRRGQRLRGVRGRSPRPVLLWEQRAEGSGQLAGRRRERCRRSQALALGWRLLQPRARASPAGAVFQRGCHLCRCCPGPTQVPSRSTHWPSVGILGWAGPGGTGEHPPPAAGCGQPGPWPPGSSWVPGTRTRGCSPPREWAAVEAEEDLGSGSFPTFRSPLWLQCRQRGQWACPWHCLSLAARPGGVSPAPQGGHRCPAGFPLRTQAGKWPAVVTAAGTERLPLAARRTLGLYGRMWCLMKALVFELGLTEQEN